MAITPRFTKADVQRILNAELLKIEQLIIESLVRLGVECVNEARQGGAYLNQTGNLRNSIGFVVYKKGGKVYEQFDKIVQNTSNEDPIAIGRQFARQIAGSMLNTSDFLLIVVAGMNYASHVENMGLDVLHSAEQYAEERLPVIVAKLKSTLSR